jgi:RNA polymerase sigma-70 factor (ECF subfamily)
MKTFEKLKDEELIKKILQHDQDALGELYHRYYKKVFQKCLSLTKDNDEAFDLAQEALLKAFDKLKNFRGESTFSTWLYIIVHRYCLEALRKRNKRCAISFQLGSGEDTEDLIECDNTSQDQSDIENIMFSLINNLPENERELLLLKYSKGESIDTLHSMYHISSSAVKMRLKRSKEKLNQLYMLATTVGLTEALSQLG